MHALLAGALGLLAWPASDAATTVDAREACASIQAARIDGLNLQSTVVTDHPELPPFCRVVGTVDPSIGFEMRLPLDDWNGRLLMSGCGAYCGQVLPDLDSYANAINFAVQRGYAAMTTDAGHQDSRVRTDWARDNRPAELLYAHAWVPPATSAARSIVEKFYGRTERFKYFAGCSNGGRTALKVAQLYPKLFDGIVSGCPTIDLIGASGLQGLWLDRTLEDAHGNLTLRADRIPLLAQAVLDRCDHVDGLTDRIVSRPFDCDFDPASLRCDSEKDDAGCLNADEVRAVRRLYGGVRDDDGKQLYPGLPFGSEPYWASTIVATSESGVRYLGPLGSDFLRNMGFARDRDPGYRSSDFDLKRDLPRLSDMRRLFNATEPDLRDFARAGGKLLMYHGLADPIVVPNLSIDYYSSVVSKFGSTEAVDDFLRLFLVPGASHCWATVGHAPDIFDPLAAIEDWVENGTPPDRIVAHQYLDGGKRISSRPALRTRPICPYPQEARYSGNGSPYSETNFTCAMPQGSRQDSSGELVRKQQ